MELQVIKSVSVKPKPADAELGFGQTFTDHMFAMEYADERGWFGARLQPYETFALDPAAVVLHYGQAMFEGVMAFRGADGRIRLFRPGAHARRMIAGAPRLCMQVPSEDQLVSSMRELTKLEADWVPHREGASLYLRPTLIATEAFLGVQPSKQYLYFVIATPVRGYFQGKDLESVRIWIESSHVRAPRGGLGAAKTPGVYAASLSATMQARQRGFDQVLWLDSAEHQYVEEAGMMNICFVIGKTLVTPPLSDSIFAGVTRDTVLTLARDFGLTVEERPFSLKELSAAHRAGVLTEVFGTGTAVSIAPVSELSTEDKTLLIHQGTPGPIARGLHAELLAIQRGLKADRHDWLVDVT
ncbi:MAG: branched-chain amino acid aminotransferase [Archangium sp.]